MSAEPPNGHRETGAVDGEIDAVGDVSPSAGRVVIVVHQVLWSTTAPYHLRSGLRVLLGHPECETDKVAIIITFINDEKVLGCRSLTELQSLSE